MNVEQIQKINNLALHLMKQGLAEDREQAVFQAEKIYQQDNSDDYANFKENMIQTEFKETSNRGMVQEKLSPDKIENILQQNTKFLVKTIKQFQVQMDLMQREINSMRSKVTYNNIPSASQILTKDVVKSPEQDITRINQAEPQTQKAPVQQVAPGINGKVPNNHPRLGTYSEEDVSVEKFFYMGSK